MHRVFKESTGQLKRSCLQLVDTKKQEIKDDTEERHDVLSFLIRSGTFSDDEMANQLLTYLAAGLVSLLPFSVRYIVCPPPRTRSLAKVGANYEIIATIRPLSLLHGRATLWPLISRSSKDSEPRCSRTFHHPNLAARQTIIMAIRKRHL
jgi:hypothetical protein